MRTAFTAFGRRASTWILRQTGRLLGSLLVPVPVPTIADSCNVPPERAPTFQGWNLDAYRQSRSIAPAKSKRPQRRQFRRPPPSRAGARPLKGTGARRPGLATPSGNKIAFVLLKYPRSHPCLSLHQLPLRSIDLPLPGREPAPPNLRFVGCAATSSANLLSTSSIVALCLA